MSTLPSWAKPKDFKPFYLLPGTKVGGYTIREALGQGGGQVAYLADAWDGREVVLKMSLYPKEEGDRHERFLRQVSYFLQLRDVPGIAHVYAHDMYPDTSENGYAYLVQEWIKGGVNILDFFRMEPRSLKVILCGWMLLGNAIAEMHRRGIVHRDLKPQNILVKPVGLGAPKIVDLDSGANVGASPLTLTGAGRWPGTRRYYSPELCEEMLIEDAVGTPVPYKFEPSSDIHALGVILYEVLTGKFPWDEGENDWEMFANIAHVIPERPRALNPEVPFGLDKVTMRLLHKKPARRYESGDELVAALESLLDTAEDWERPFQTPARSRYEDQSRSGLRAVSTAKSEASTPTTSTTPSASSGSAAFKLAPSAIVLAEPRPLVVRGPRALLRLAPAPSALAPAAAPPQTRPRHIRRFVAAGLAALVLTVAVQSTSAEHSLLKTGNAELGRAKVAALALVSTILAACPSLTGRVRADDKAWLNTKCPADARKAAQDFDLDPTAPAAWEPGPNNIGHDYGTTEVKDGPVEVAALLATAKGGIPVRLFGEIRTGADGASIKLTRGRVESDGREFPICAIVYVQGSRDNPGIPKTEVGPFPHASELHPGFVLVSDLRALMVEIAR